MRLDQLRLPYRLGLSVSSACRTAVIAALPSAIVWTEWNKVVAGYVRPILVTGVVICATAGVAAAGLLSIGQEEHDLHGIRSGAGGEQLLAKEDPVGDEGPSFWVVTPSLPFCVLGDGSAESCFVVDEIGALVCTCSELHQTDARKLVLDRQGTHDLLCELADLPSVVVDAAAAIQNDNHVGNQVALGSHSWEQCQRGGKQQQSRGVSAHEQ